MKDQEPRPALVDRYEAVSVPAEIVTEELLDDTVLPQADAFLANVVNSLQLTDRTRTDYISETINITTPSRAIEDERPYYLHQVWFGDVQELASFRITQDRKRRIVRFAKYALSSDVIETIEGIEICEDIETRGIPLRGL